MWFGSWSGGLSPFLLTMSYLYIFGGIVEHNENLGAAERIINAILNYQDHLVHNRIGIVVPDNRTNIGVRWDPISYKLENDQKVAYRIAKTGSRVTRTRLGVINPDGSVIDQNNIVIGNFRPSGIFPEVANWMYRQIAEVWKLDNEFAAKWASYAFEQEHRDIKVALAAFLMVQSRCGDAVREDGKILFYDEDYRDVGEAMALIYEKDKNNLNPKLLLRINDLLSLPGVAEINRELGFGKSARKPFLGRWPKVVDKWLRYREENPKLLEGLIRAGFRSTVMELARRVGYKPNSEIFFDVLRWKQVQKDDGRRQLAIGKTVIAAETWTNLNEMQICEKIVAEKPNFKRIASMIPKNIGLTRAIMAAAIDAESLSNKDLIIYSPTLEELGLLQVQNIRERWELAIKVAEDQRAANIASRMKNKDAQEKLQEAADNAVKKAVEEVVRGMRIYFMVDVSGSMQGAIEAAKEYIAKFLQGFPPDKIHVSIFNTAGREIKITHPSAAGVTNAFRGVTAGGGTDYSAGVRVLQKHQPATDEDVLFIFVGDEQAASFAAAVRQSNLNPLAFGLLRIVSAQFFGGRYFAGGTCVQDTATELGIPCFKIEKEIFTDPYALPRTIRALIAATPVGQVNRPVQQRVSLIDTILQTELLKKPVWA